MSSTAAVPKEGVEQPEAGLTIQKPCAEATLLEPERKAKVKPGSFVWVIDAFAFVNVRNEEFEFVELSVDQYSKKKWKDICVVGAVASLVGHGSMFAQCGWFTRMAWLWFQVGNIQEIVVKSDDRFRAGERRIWLKTKLGEYTMLRPHDCYVNHWDRTLKSLGSLASCEDFQRLSRTADRPRWWGNNAVDSWSNGSSPPTAILKRARESDEGDSMKRAQIHTPNAVSKTESSQVQLKTTSNQRESWSLIGDYRRPPQKPDPEDGKVASTS
ncbi:hypothetical protein FRC09_008140 [Ceratobasidium sp. 395]|nr:hypothetical protein FRC09_008140 [Ceratobasidium sp. 395]